MAQLVTSSLNVSLAVSLGSIVVLCGIEAAVINSVNVTMFGPVWCES